MRAVIKDNKKIVAGFTFAELLVVLAIIAILVSVTAPYASQSNRNLKLQQEACNLSAAISYLIDLTQSTQRPTRLALDIKAKSYVLEIAYDGHTDRFKPIDGYLGRERYLDKKFRFDEIKGFDTDGRKEYLLFDPAQPWPAASFALVTNEGIRIIKIDGLENKIFDDYL